MSNLNLSDIEIYDGMSYDKLLKQIHVNHRKKDSQITKLINDLSKLVKDTSDANLLVPLIANYLNVSVRNDDQLVKLATIVQKLIKPEAREGDGGLTAEERKEIEELTRSMQSEETRIFKIG